MATAILASVHSFILESSVKHIPMHVHSHHALMAVPAPSQAMEPRMSVPVRRVTPEPTVKSLTHVILAHVSMELHAKQTETATFASVSSSTQVTNVRRIRMPVIANRVRMEAPARSKEMDSHMFAHARTATQELTVRPSMLATATHA